MKKLIDLIKYAFWGCVSTAVNLAVLFAMITFTDIHYIIANTLAYILAVIINYICNKLFVFKTHADTKKEFFSFALMRVISLLVDNVCYYIMVDLLGWDVYISKILLSLVIIGVTYVINKRVIFKKEKE